MVLSGSAALKTRLKFIWKGKWGKNLDPTPKWISVAEEKHKKTGLLWMMDSTPKRIHEVKVW